MKPEQIEPLLGDNKRKFLMTFYPPISAWRDQTKSDVVRLKGMVQRGYDLRSGGWQSRKADGASESWTLGYCRKQERRVRSINIKNVVSLEPIGRRLI